MFTDNMYFFNIFLGYYMVFFKKCGNMGGNRLAIVNQTVYKLC